MLAITMIETHTLRPSLLAGVRLQLHGASLDESTPADGHAGSGTLIDDSKLNDMDLMGWLDCLSHELDHGIR